MNFVPHRKHDMLSFERTRSKCGIWTFFVYSKRGCGPVVWEITDDDDDDDDDDDSKNCGL
jgi:hypothetical protein